MEGQGWLHAVFVARRWSVCQAVTGAAPFDTPPPPSGLGNFKGVMLCSALKRLWGEMRQKWSQWYGCEVIAQPMKSRLWPRFPCLLGRGTG